MGGAEGTHAVDITAVAMSTVLCMSVSELKWRLGAGVKVVCNGGLKQVQERCGAGPQSRLVNIRLLVLHRRARGGEPVRFLALSLLAACRAAGCGISFVPSTAMRESAEVSRFTNDSG